MTRRHFQIIANIVKGIDDTATRQRVAMDFAHALRAENPRFDVTRFVQACNGPWHAVTGAAINEGLDKVTF